MAWIESHTTLKEHPKTKRLCRLLKLKRRDAVGLLHMMWWWALDYAPEGDLSSVPDEDIADAVDWKGDGAALVSALVEAGFVDDDRQIHDWDEFAEKRIARRRANAARMRAARAARANDDTNARAAHVQDTSGARVKLPERPERPERPETSPKPPPQAEGAGKSRGRRSSDNGITTAPARLPAVDVRTY